VEKKLMLSCVLTILLLLTGTFVSDAAIEGETLLDRAKNASSPERPYTSLKIGQGNTLEEFTCEGAYIPIRDLFASRVSEIRWDNKSKIAEVVNDGKSLVLNFSNQEIESTDTKIVLPKEWIRMSQGKTEIHAAVLAYIFNIYADRFPDEERDEWREKLSFLGIQGTDAISEGKGVHLQVFVTFKENT
jgi:SHS2 domain-containing protein